MTGMWQPPRDTQMQSDINGEICLWPCAQGGSCTAPCLELGYEIKRQLRLIRSLEFSSTLLIEKVYFHNGGRAHTWGADLADTGGEGSYTVNTACVACRSNYFLLKWLAF